MNGVGAKNIVLSALKLLEISPANESKSKSTIGRLKNP